VLPIENLLEETLSHYEWARAFTRFFREYEQRPATSLCFWMQQSFTAADRIAHD
jgi:hypothetical protein